MKSLRYLSIALVLFAIAGATSAFAGGSVIVTNGTTYTIGEFYASLSDSSGWDTTDNLLAGQLIGPGQSTTITINDGSSECAYDLMAVMYGASQYAYQYEVNACSGGTWTVTFGQ